MKPCTYIYKETDKKVIAGKVKTGDQCGCCRATESTRWLCGGHYTKWLSENEPEKLAEARKKQRESLTKYHKKLRDRNKEIFENRQTEISGETKEIVDAIGLGVEFDLAQEYAIYKQLNIDPTMEHYDEKFAFAMWLNTPEPKRTPKNIKDVPGILGVSEVTLQLWRRSPELSRIMTSKTREIVSTSYKLVWEKLMERVKAGDPRCFDIALKHIKEVLAVDENKSKFPPLPQEVLDQSKKICADGTANMLKGVSNQATKTAAYDALLNGNVKPDETVQ